MTPVPCGQHAALPLEVERVELQFRLTIADLRAFQRELYVGPWGRRWRPPGYAVALVGLGSLVGSWRAYLAVAVFLGAMALLTFVVAPARGRRRSPDLQALQQWAISPDAIKHTSLDDDGSLRSRAELSWRAVVRWRETKHSFLISTHPDRAFILPRSALTAEQTQRLRSMLESAATRAIGTRSRFVQRFKVALVGSHDSLRERSNNRSRMGVGRVGALSQHATCPLARDTRISERHCLLWMPAKAVAEKTGAR
jgi:hypothetical protein